ncbi:MAG: hypothetical protein M1823_002168 [Watsoniomyces obsoletus]|nr:MAG: hypothetical protein M1823_002168 [Watsoniomyces obsoletus]
MEISLPGSKAEASAYQKAHGTSDATTALQKARNIEQKSFDTADSFHHYEAICSEAITEFNGSNLENIAAAPEDDQEQSNEIPETQGSQFGQYQNAIYHRDGLFSTVYRAISPNGKVVALKVTTPSTMHPPHNSEREARILRKVSTSSHVIPLLDSFRFRGDRFVLVFPFQPTDLEQLLRTSSLSEKRAKNCLLDLFNALEYIHSKGIIHRDIKPSNILLHDRLDGPAYLADFGIAWCEDDPASEKTDGKITDVGTTSFRPPELLFGYTAYDETLDLWAAGCVVAEVVMASPNRSLFDSGPLGSELALIRSIFMSLGTPTEEIWPEAAKFPDWGKMAFHMYPPKPWTELLPGASEVARDLVSRLVRLESKSRLTAAEVPSNGSGIQLALVNGHFTAEAAQ